MNIIRNLVFVFVLSMVGCSLNPQQVICNGIIVKVHTWGNVVNWVDVEDNNGNRYRVVPYGEPWFSVGDKVEIIAYSKDRLDGAYARRIK